MNLTWKNVNVSVPARKNLCGRKVSDRKIILQDGEKLLNLYSKFFMEQLHVKSSLVFCYPHP